MSYFDPQNPGISGLDELTDAEEIFLTTLAGLVGDENDVLTWKSGAPSWEASGAGVTTFLALTDTPSDYTDDALKGVRVNATADGLEFYTTTDADEKVKYDAGDPTAGYVADKIVAGTGISVAEGTGANENKLVVTSTITQATRDSLGLDTDDTVTFGNLSGTNTGDQVGDGVTITGAGTVGDPFVSSGGGLSESLAIAFAVAL